MTATELTENNVVRHPVPKEMGERLDLQPTKPDIVAEDRQGPSFRNMLLLRVLGVLVAIAIWQLLTSLQALGEQFGPAFSPLSAARAFWQMATSGKIGGQIWPSLQRIFVGLTVAGMIGIPVGVLVGYYRSLDAATSMVFQFLRMISPLAWMPIAIIAFGIGDRPIYFLIAVVAVWPIIINTAHGVGSIEPIWLKVAKNLGTGEMAILRRVVVPAVVPDMLTGVRVAIGVSWVVLVPAEMLGVSSGLGYYILDTRDRFSYDELMAVILLIGILGFGLDWAVRSVQRRFSWNIS